MFYKYLVFVIFLCSFSLTAQELNRVNVNEDDLLLLSVKLDSYKVGQSIDAYQNGEQLLVAIEPLFDILQVKYQLYKDNVQVWKGDNKYKFDLLNQGSASLSALSPLEKIWADDGYYIYLSAEELKTLFDIEIELDRRRLLFTIKTDKYKFPITVLAEQAKKRLLAQTNKRQNQDDSIVDVPITIEDQYRLATLPTGFLSSRLALDNNKQNNNITMQLVSDLLYHSANININKSQGSDVSGGLSLSRYKTSENNYLLGAFDYYRLGDISSIQNSRLSKGLNGVGINFVRAPKSFRRENAKITIEKIAPPGWEAELYHNNQFVEVVTVPETGLLVFEDTDVIYGNNRFVIKLYGPFGEQQEFIDTYNLKANPLSAGSMAYSLYTLDSNRTLFNNGNEQESFELDTVGGTFDYGISDLWQVGVGFSQKKNIEINTQDNQFFNIKNNFNLPGLLLENELVFDSDGNYQQKTSMLGRVFSEGSYNIDFNSGSGGFEGRDNRASGKFQNLSTSYTNNLSGLRYRFDIGYSNNELNNIVSLSNTLAYKFKYYAVTHDIQYSDFSQKTNSFGASEANNYSINGRLGISTAINRDFRLSANLAYNPKDEDDVISKSSSFSARWHLRDPWDLSHYINLNYRPISDSDKKWQLSHNMAWEAPSHRLSLQTRYEQTGNWSLSLNFSFFFGYDYHNNRTHFSNNINTRSASLNIHNYLDRQHNGRPDVLDYNLEGVTYTGNPDWVNRSSGKNGRILLHGATVNTPLQFQAHWKNGSKSIKNDYVIYTHPGARVDVNMPFYLSSELSGFILRGTNEVPIGNITVDLIDETGLIVDSQKTDIDGYYEFIEMKPNRYQVRINENSLRDKALTGDVVGYQLMTPSSGGFAELPSIILNRIEQENYTDKESILPFIISEDMQEPIIYVEDATVLNNLFVLPVTEQVDVQHDLSKALTIVKTKNKKNRDESLGGSAPIVSTEEKANVSVNKVVNNQVNKTNLLLQSDKEEEGYTLQLGSFLRREGAERVIQQYSQLNLQPRLENIINANGQSIYRVYLGEFTAKEQARRFAEENNLSVNSYLVRKILIGNNILNNLVSLESGEGFIAENSNDTVKVNKIERPDTVKVLGNWVIQLYANKSGFEESSVKPFSHIDSLKYALKNVKGSEQPWYCLISGPYQSKQQALDEVKRLNLKAWVTELSNYHNVTRVVKD